jgi:hypothetical protein
MVSKDALRGLAVLGVNEQGLIIKEQEKVSEGEIILGIVYVLSMWGEQADLNYIDMVEIIPQQNENLEPFINFLNENDIRYHYLAK